MSKAVASKPDTDQRKLAGEALVYPTQFPASPNGMDVGHWGRQSVILRDARPIDPEAALEKRMTAERGLQLGEGVGKDRRKDKGKGKKGKWKEGVGEGKRNGGEEVVRGAEAAQNDASPMEGAGLSMHKDIPRGNGERVRVREEDHYGFLYSISEADRH